MSIWANNGNGKKCLAGTGMEIGLKLVGMGRNRKAESHSHTPLLHTLHTGRVSIHHCRITAL